MTRVDITLLIALSTVYLLVTSVAAVSFTASVTPNILNASDTDKLLNFTIANSNTTHNITELNVTLPSGFTYSSSGGTNVTVSYSFSSGSVVDWKNTSIVGLIGPSGTAYFWFKVNAPSVNISYNFNVSATDNSAIYSSVNVSLTVADLLPPKYSSNSSSPSSPATYVKDRTYEFSMTWTDNVAVSAALMEHNFTGSFANYTTTQTGAVYNYSYRDLPVGFYAWRMYANDTNNTFNATDQFQLNVTKATNEITVYFNGLANQNIQATNISALNVTAAATTGTVYIYRDNTLVVSGTTPQTSSVTLVAGSYTYKANATGNANFSDNSTGVSQVATITAPSPQWSSNSTSFPSSYTNGTLSTFSTTWVDPLDSSGFSTSIIEANWTGSFVNYTMYRVPGTNTSRYNVTLPAGEIRWRVFANNSNNVFNSTPIFVSNLPKGNVTLVFSSSPAWTVEVGATTNVTCTSSIGGITIKLYRDHTAVSNLDVQTLSVGSYVYTCNITGHQNYSVSENIELKISQFIKYLSILQISSAIKIIEVEENSNTSAIIEVKNTGNKTDDVKLEIENIDSSWYKIRVNSTTIGPRGAVGSFLIDFSVPDTEIKDYVGRFNVSGKNETVYSNFTLRVLPGKEEKKNINDTFLIYKTQFANLRKEIDEFKSQNKSIGEAETKYSELKAKIEQVENYVNQNDYFKAYNSLSEIKSLIDATKGQLSSAQEVEKQKEQQEQQGNLLFYGLIAGGVIVVGVLAYLLWPTKSQYAPGKLKISKEQIAAHVENIKDKVVEKLSISKPQPQEPSVVWDSLKQKWAEVTKKKSWKYKYGSGK